MPRDWIIPKASKAGGQNGWPAQGFLILLHPLSTKGWRWSFLPPPLWIPAPYRGTGPALRRNHHGLAKLIKGRIRATVLNVNFKGRLLG